MVETWIFRVGTTLAAVTDPAPLDVRDRFPGIVSGAYPGWSRFDGPAGTQVLAAAIEGDGAGAEQGVAAAAGAGAGVVEDEVELDAATDGHRRHGWRRIGR